MRTEAKAMVLGVATGAMLMFPSSAMLSAQEEDNEMCADGYVFVPQSVPGNHAECEDPDQLMASIEDQLDAAGSPMTSMALNDWYSWYANDPAGTNVAEEQRVIAMSEQILDAQLKGEAVFAEDLPPLVIDAMKQDDWQGIAGDGCECLYPAWVFAGR